MAVKRACAEPGCSALVLVGRCREHDRRRLLDRQRGSARERGYDRRWEAIRAAFLEERAALAQAEAGEDVVRLAQVAALGGRLADGTWHPLPPCAHCVAAGRLAPGSIADHIIPHRGDRFLLRCVENLQPLCSDCHGLKGTRETGIAACPHSLKALVVGREICVLCGRWA